MEGIDVNILFKEDKQKLREYQKNYPEAKKMLLQKMSKWFLNFGEKDVLKNAFQKFKYPTDVNETIIGDTVIFNKDCKKGFKYFSGYNNYDQVKPLRIMLPKLSGYVTFFNGTMYMCLLWLKRKNYWKHTLKCGINLGI